MCFTPRSFASGNIERARRRIEEGNLEAAENLLNVLNAEKSMRTIIIDGKSVAQHIRELRSQINSSNEFLADLKQRLA